MSTEDTNAARRGSESNDLLGLRWAASPQRTQWGPGMMEALVALGKDHTLRIFAEVEVLHLVEPALISAAVAAERERWQRDQQAWEDTRTQRDELLAHIAGKAPLPEWAADWLKA